MKRLIRILPHITIVLSLMFMTFLALDNFNPQMNFINSKMSKLLLSLFCISSMVTAIITVYLDSKSDQSDIGGMVGDSHIHQ